MKLTLQNVTMTSFSIALFPSNLQVEVLHAVLGMTKTLTKVYI